MDVVDLASWMSAIGYSQEIEDFFNEDLDDSPTPPPSPFRRAKKRPSIMSIRNRFGSQGLAGTPLIGDLFYCAENWGMYELGLKMESAVDHYGDMEQDLFNDACLDLESIANPARLGPDATANTKELLATHRKNCQDLLRDLGGRKFGRAWWNEILFPILAIQNFEMPDERITKLCDDIHVRVGIILDGKKKFDASRSALKIALSGLALESQGQGRSRNTGSSGSS